MAIVILPLNTVPTGTYRYLFVCFIIFLNKSSSDSRYVGRWPDTKRYAFVRTKDIDFCCQEHIRRGVHVPQEREPGLQLPDLQPSGHVPLPPRHHWLRSLCPQGGYNDFRHVLVTDFKSVLFRAEDQHSFFCGSESS